MKKKKVLSAILTFAITLSIFQGAVPVTASDYNEATYEDGDETTQSQSVNVAGQRGGDFVVAVPKSDVLTSSEENSLKVGIYANIPVTKQIVIEPIDELPENTDAINFTLQNIVIEGATAKDNIAGTITPTKTSFAWNDADLCTDLATIVNPENMVEICKYSAAITAGEWSGNIGLRVGLEDASETAGLYDANGVMLCSWEESGIDVGMDYTMGENDSTYYGTATTSPYYVLTNTYTTATQVVIPDNVRRIGNSAFYGCGRLTSITIPNSVTSFGNLAFDNCENLTSVTIPESVTSISESAFENCRSLTSVTIPDSVTSIGNSAFRYCRSLTSITIPDSVTNISDNAFSDCTSLTSITIPSGVTSIGESAFDNCENLTSVTIPDSVTSICRYAFGDCTSLTSVTIPDSVTSIGNFAFAGCTGLTSITIPNSVTSIGNGAFRVCNGLTSVTISSSLTSIGKEVFYGC